MQFTFIKCPGSEFNKIRQFEGLPTINDIYYTIR